MKKNETVEYLGCCEEQIKWGNNDDPRSLLVVGKHYQIEKVNVRSQHTKIKLYNKMGWFNSVCFKIVENELNNFVVSSIGNMNPSEITLSTPSKSFAYEQQAREIEKCESMEELRNICKCYAKLYYKQQETLGTIGAL